MSRARRYDVVIRPGHRCFFRAWLKITSLIIEGSDDGKEEKNIYFFSFFHFPRRICFITYCFCVLVHFFPVWNMIFPNVFVRYRPPSVATVFNFDKTLGTYIFFMPMTNRNPDIVCFSFIYTRHSWNPVWNLRALFHKIEESNIKKLKMYRLF